MTETVLKLLGAAAVMLSAAVYERGLSARRKAATRQLEGFLTLFRALRSGIGAYTPMGDILARMPSETLAACIGRDGKIRVESLEALTEDCLFLTDGLEALVKGAATELGRGYREGQLTLCDGYLAALEKLHGEGQKKERELSGYVRPLLFTGAAGLVILLL